MLKKEIFKKEGLLSPVKQKLSIDFKGEHSMAELIGDRDELLQLIERKYNVEIFALGNDLEISGKNKNVKEVARLIEELALQINLGQKLNSEKVSDSIKIMENKSNLKPHEIFKNSIVVNSGKKIKPRTEGQKKYIEAIKENTIVFGIGPAGTGKTYLALAMAVEALRENKVGRIILIKPVVEAGEKLGFLPGDIYDKVNPYLRPLYDALYEMLDIEKFQQYRDMGIIEVAPLAYMRGRTLNDSFIILDEAQNTSPEQMKMFLTRLGFGSRIVVTGDITQIDLPSDKESGLIIVKNILIGIHGVEFVYLSSKDVVRHELVQRIVDAYKVYGERTKR
ncbi:MAG: PhoH family protein [Actinobacteria bacterium]|jgi:phosphate starvation-inducible PhoH-like protein|nr:MAG: PhoH family protein [Actinomycetota bacterium]